MFPVIQFNVRRNRRAHDLLLSSAAALNVELPLVSGPNEWSSRRVWTRLTGGNYRES